MNEERLQRLEQLFDSEDMEVSGEFPFFLWRSYPVRTRGNGAYFLAWSLVHLIEMEHGEDEAGRIFDVFLDKLEEENSQPTTAIDFLHFIADNISLCPLKKENQRK